MMKVPLIWAFSVLLPFSIQTAHGVQQIIERQNVRRILEGAFQPGDTDTGTNGNAVQNLPQVEHLAHILQAQRGDVVIPANHEIRNARLVSDGQIGDRLRQMQVFQNTAVGQLDTRHRRPFKVKMLNVGAAGHIHSLLEVRAVAGIQRPQQGVVAQVQFGQVAVGVAVCRISDLQALKPGGHGEIRVAHHQPGKVADGLQLTGTVDINLGVVHIGQRTGQRVCHVSVGPLLHQIGAVLHRSVDICIRRDGNIILGVATEGHHIGQGIPGIVLGVQIAEPVIQPPLSLLCLGALQHGKVAGCVLLHQGLEVLEVGILIEHCFGPLRLMLLKPLFRHGEGQRAIGAQLLVHGLDVLIECLPDINPQDGLLTVVDISPGLGVVDVLQIVGEHQRTFVVDADGRIEVIGQREPLAPRHEGREHILGPGVHHQEQFRE